MKVGSMIVGALGTLLLFVVPAQADDSSEQGLR